MEPGGQPGPGLPGLGAPARAGRAVPDLAHHSSALGKPLPAAGHGGMGDRSSRPRTSPARTPVRTERRSIKLRVTRCWARRGSHSGWALYPSIVHKVLARYGCPRLAHRPRGPA